MAHVADTLVDNLTVREMLDYTSNMKLPHTTPQSVKLDAVSRVIATLNLEKCCDTVIGNASSRGISGGQVGAGPRTGGSLPSPLLIVSCASAGYSDDGGDRSEPHPCHVWQAKRVNIAVSIITKPLVLYLDEPTSGLVSEGGNHVSVVLWAP